MKIVIFLVTIAGLAAVGHCQSCAEGNELPDAVCQVYLDGGFCIQAAQNAQCYVTCNPKECNTSPCPALPQIENGTHFPMQATYTVGESVVYGCDPGFILEGQVGNECQADQTWTQTVAPLCNELCPSPPTSPILNLVTTGNQHFEGDMVQYTCKENGAKVVGDDTSTCVRNGTGHLTWSLDPLPACDTAGSCTAPPLITSNGVKPEDRSYFDGETATYECAQYYNLIGVETNLCVNGTWTNPMAPLCVEPCADRLQESTCASYNSSGRCQTDELLKGFCRKTCDICGDCTNAPPTSTGVSEPGQEPYKGGDVISYSCRRFTAVDGFDKNVCLGSNTWGFDAPPGCKLCHWSIF